MQQKLQHLVSCAKCLSLCFSSLLFVLPTSKSPHSIFRIRPTSIKLLSYYVIIIFSFIHADHLFDYFIKLYVSQHIISHATRNILKHKFLHFIKLVTCCRILKGVTGHGPSNAAPSLGVLLMDDSLLFILQLK